MENKEIFSALVAFSALDVQVVKNKTNPHFKNKYADLQEILEKVKKPLASCGLALYQSVRGENTLITKLVHISGESLEEIFTFKDASNMQGLGSAITYAKRYQICAMLGLAADDDDDAAGHLHGGHRAVVGPGARTRAGDRNRQLRRH